MLKFKPKLKTKSFRLLFAVDNTRPYGDVIALMSNLQDAGLTQVGLLTEPLK